MDSITKFQILMKKGEDYNHYYRLKGKFVEKEAK